VKAVNDKGNMEEENAGQWSTAEVACLLTLWGEQSVQDKIKGSYRNKSVFKDITCVVQEPPFKNARCFRWHGKCKHMNRIWVKIERTCKRTKKKKIRYRQQIRIGHQGLQCKLSLCNLWPSSG